VSWAGRQRKTGYCVGTVASTLTHNGARTWRHNTRACLAWPRHALHGPGMPCMAQACLAWPRHALHGAGMPYWRRHAVRLPHLRARVTRLCSRMAGPPATRRAAAQSVRPSVTASWRISRASARGERSSSSGRRTTMVASLEGSAPGSRRASACMRCSRTFSVSWGWGVAAQEKCGGLALLACTMRLRQQ
jgi:hypothetical protein